MILAGYRLRKDTLFKGRIDPETAIGRYLLDHLETVQPLTRLARNVIRRKLGTINVQKKLMTLPLPSVMLKYLDLRDLLDVIPENEFGAYNQDDDFVVVPKLGLKETEA